ncbi:ABC transporter ATP-binding protein [Anaerotalea alkaliphila]|uniref:ABC transporter ATP-binding protein n=1 Tax=Anaerotalea alkaliphila TaxID=2662126 RepID=A0A7X5KNX9_9FIRM|nr:ABC transporter ATP-binding protein [Anaerotalea alkaliphila]NDL68414.1 ABC transporter ATP-binding protein [Anaerotalea alkaliphila]
MMPHKKPKDAMKTVGRLFSYLRGRYRLQFGLVLVCILLSTAAGIAASLFLQVLIDDHILPLQAAADPDFGGLGRAMTAMGGIYLAGVLGAYVYSRLTVVIAQGVLKEVRDKMFAHMQALPVRYFDTHASGDIMSRYTNDTDTLRQMFAHSLPQLFSSVFTIVGVFAAMAATSLPLTGVVLGTMGVLLLVMKKVAGLSGKHFVRQQESLGKANGYIEEMINGQKVVKVFCHEEEAKARFDALNEELCDNATQANRLANSLMPLVGSIGNLQYVLIAIAGGALAVRGVGGVTLGAIASFLQLSRTLGMPVSHVSQQVSSVVMAIAGAERIFNLLDEPVEADEGQVTLVHARREGDAWTEAKERTGNWAWKHPRRDGTVTYTRLAGEVSLHDVDFSYDGEKKVLHNVSLHALPGRKVAFVGATGAGKTTIANLINRFYDIADGKIRYDGININKIKKSDLRRSLGIVLQDTNLFTGTVRENIRYGRLEATDAEVERAAKRANAHSFISMLPQGYDTVLTGDGAGLSQGQRQLLSIARAEIADAPVMILDEATSSIDTRTEAIVQKGMDALMQGRTVFVIAHRLSTVHNSDVILVLEQGRVIEEGTHQELVRKKGRYHQLYTGAFELE